MKKLYIILGILLAIIIAVGVYLFFFRTTPPSGSNGTPTGSIPTTGTLPTIGEQTGSNNAPGGTTNTGDTGSLPVAGGTIGQSSFGVISNEPVLEYFVDATNKTFVIEPDGKIAMVENGVATVINSAGAENIISAHFSANGTKLFMNYGDPANPQTSIFDIATKQWTALPIGLMSPVWAPNDNRIAYIKRGTSGILTLSTLDVSKAANRPVPQLTIHAEDLTLSWPTNNRIVLADKPSAFEKGSALLFDVTKKTVSRSIAPVNGFAATFDSTTSSLALIFRGGDASRGGALSLWNSAANTAQSLTLLTLPEKCYFHGALYCGVPADTNALSNASLPDAYEQMRLFTSDSLIRINALTGDMENLLFPTQAMDISNIKVFGKTLFFVNRYDSKLYALSLGV